MYQTAAVTVVTAVQLILRKLNFLFVDEPLSDVNSKTWLSACLLRKDR